MQQLKDAFSFKYIFLNISPLIIISRSLMIKQDRSDKSSSIDLRPLHQALGGRRGHQALGGKQGHQGETDLKKSSSTGLRLLFLVDHLDEDEI